MDIKYYHVADETYKSKSPLLSRDRLVASGQAPEWKWEDASEGFDGDVVCLFDTLAEARVFQAEHGGKILEVRISHEDIDDPIDWSTPYGIIHPRLTQVEEGYTAVTDGIPAEWISEIEGE